MTKFTLLSILLLLTLAGKYGYGQNQRAQNVYVKEGGVGLGATVTYVSGNDGAIIFNDGSESGLQFSSLLCWN